MVNIFAFANQHFKDEEVTLVILRLFISWISIFCLDYKTFE